jgi:hypothetical protein
MGWNDRLPEDPYIPTESYYDRQEYEAWMEYIASKNAPPAAGLSSQNLDPALLQPEAQPNLLQRLWRRVQGQPAQPADKTPF